MPSSVLGESTREGSPASGSEKSFVSAASENTSNWSNKNLGIDQSAPARLPSPTRHTSVTLTDFNSLSTPKASDTNHHLTAGKEVFSPSSPASSFPPAPQSGSYFSPQPGASGNEARSPPIKRPPASRSSHGIATSSGPPPALSTRRSYNAESRLRNPPTSPRATHPPTVHSTSIDSIVRQTHQTVDDSTESRDSEGVRSIQRQKSSIVEGGKIKMDGRYEIQSGSEEDRDPTLRINGHRKKTGAHIRKESGQQKSQSSQEDLFLNLARADSVVENGPEQSNRSERKHSRFRGSSLQQSRESRPTSSHRPSTSVGGSGQRISSMQHKYDRESSFNPTSHCSPENGSLFSFKDSSTKSRTYAASAHPLDQRPRSSNIRTSLGGLSRDDTAQDRSTGLPLGSGRRRAIPDPSLGPVGLGYTQSNLSYTPNGHYGSSYFSNHQDQGQEADEDPQTPHAEGTESTVSTTAPSTVWDELEDMKSRIRKLELTGKLPASSNAAMSNTVREGPPTATTTMTTNSLSPKRRHMNSISPEASTVKAPEIANLHPLLHAALSKTKSNINANLYRALEATASDALALAAIAGNANAQSISPSTASFAGTSNVDDRRLRRKADNMCRSLTELCIALSEESQEAESAVAKIRPRSKDGSIAAQRNESTLQALMSVRATNDEPHYRSSSRVMDRLEARRASLALGSSPFNRRESPQEASSPAQAVSPGSGRLDRASSGINRSRVSEDQRDIVSSRRPLSRASTEIGQVRHSPQTRTSREYTSQHPMPNPQRSPSVQSSLPARKSYFPSASQSPITPNMQLGSRRYIERSTPPSSADSSRLAEARQRRIASLSQHTSVR